MVVYRIMPQEQWELLEKYNKKLLSFEEYKKELASLLNDWSISKNGEKYVFFFEYAESCLKFRYSEGGYLCRFIIPDELCSEYSTERFI